MEQKIILDTKTKFKINIMDKNHRLFIARYYYFIFSKVVHACGGINKEHKNALEFDHINLLLLVSYFLVFYFLANTF